MAFTQNLLFLGPSIAALITSAYALRQARTDRSADLVDPRVKSSSDFLNAANACAKTEYGEARAATVRTLNNAARNVQLTFGEEVEVLSAAESVRKSALTLAKQLCPRPLGDKVVLAELRDLVEEEETEAGPGPWTGAAHTLALVLSFRKSQEDAVANGRRQPDIGSIVSYFEEPDGLSSSVLEALPSAVERAKYEEALAMHERASNRMEEAQDRFVRVAGQCTHAPFQGKPQRRSINAASPALRKIAPVSEGREGSAARE